MAFDRNGSDLAGKFFYSVILALVLMAGFAAPAAAQGVVKGKFGDWEMRCETPPGAARDQCALMQSVAAEDKPNVNLVVIVLKTADGKSRLLRVIAPLGVLLPSGLGLKVDRPTLAAPVSSVACRPVASPKWSWKTSCSINCARRSDGHLHHFPDAGGRHRHSAGAQWFQGRFRQVALTYVNGS